MIETLSDLLRKLGAHYLLVLGIVIIVLWLLISGFRRGWKKREDREKGDDQNYPDDGPSTSSG
jgi:hypothetical protein